MAAFIGKRESDMFIAPFWKWASMECQWFWLCILGYLRGDWMQTSIHEELAASRGRTTVAHALPHSENECRRSLNDFWSCIIGNICVALWQWFIYHVMMAYSAETVQDIFVTPSRKWGSTERKHCLILYIGSRHHVDIWDHTRTIDHLSSPKYKTQKEKHWFQNNQYCNLQRIYKVITGCWISDFDQILLSNIKTKSRLWNYR